MRGAAVIVVAAATLSVTAAYVLEMPDFWSKFGAVKVMEGCLGRNNTEFFVKYVTKALRDCGKETQLDQGEAIASLESTNWEQIFKQYTPQSQNEFLPDITERTNNVKNKLASIIKKFRCAMQRVFMTDKNNNIDVDKIVEGYKSLGLAQPLLDELLVGVNQCYNLTQCTPLGHFYGTPIPDDVLRVKTFMNCERYMRNWACLKDYVKRFVDEGEFDFSGADGTLDFLPNDEARAAAIGIANQLVGGDDFGLYE